MFQLIEMFTIRLARLHAHHHELVRCGLIARSFAPLCAGVRVESVDQICVACARDANEHSDAPAHRAQDPWPGALGAALHAAPRAPRRLHPAAAQIRQPQPRRHALHCALVCADERRLDARRGALSANDAGGTGRSGGTDGERAGAGGATGGGQGAALGNGRNGPKAVLVESTTDSGKAL